MGGENPYYFVVWKTKEAAKYFTLEPNPQLVWQTWGQGVFSEAALYIFLGQVWEWKVEGREQGLCGDQGLW